MAEPIDRREFRARVREKHSGAFALHREVAEAFEPAVLTKRPLPTHIHVAIDMLMTQAYKTHHAVSLMAERAQAEDAATLTRRLMELSVQALYIGYNEDGQISSDRAGCYLAWLWHSMPDELKVHIPESGKRAWQIIFDLHAPRLPKGRRRWGPLFRDMFAELGLLDAYEQDYTLLSAIAHGGTQEALLHYSQTIVNLRSDLHVPVLLIYASRYYVAVAEAWNKHFQRIEPAVLTKFKERVVEERGKVSSPP